MSAEDEVVPTQEGYDRWAEIYDDELNPLVIVEAPEVRRALGEVRGLDLLDVGCGTGRHAVEFARAGARVTGVDFSKGMLEKARAKPGADAVRFVHQDAAALPFEARAFDRVISCLVLDHVSDVKGFFAELRRVCRDEGLVVISVMHPAMMLKGTQARFTDPKTGGKVWPRSVPNQISDYVMGALDAGMRVRALSEHAVRAEHVAQAPRAEKYLGWPILFMMELTPS